MRPQPLIAATDVEASSRACELGAEVVMAPHRNPPDGRGGPNHREIWLRDPDGYGIVVASPDGEAGPPPG